MAGDLAATAAVTADFGSARLTGGWRFNLKWELALGRTAGQIDWQTDGQTNRRRRGGASQG